MLGIPVLFVALLTLAQSAPAAKADPREQLPTAIAEAIRLLDAKEYVTFLKTFMSPDALKAKESSEGGLEAFAERFFGDSPRVSQFLEALKEIKTKQAKPVMENGDTIATYTLSGEAGRLTTLRFEKTGTDWYLFRVTVRSPNRTSWRPMHSTARPHLQAA